jgi:L-cysteine S-thiosulfotransferase
LKTIERSIRELIMKKIQLKTLVAASIAVAALTSCSTTPLGPDYDALMADMLKTSFREQGIAKVDRLTQDIANAECSGKEPDDKRSKAIEEANLKLVKYPADGKFLGDWKAGEVVAQSGRGATWSDAATAVNGGNCYNCHQISKQEISHGTIGPSLYNYGKLRQVKDPASTASAPIVKYTWGKIYNAKAYNACSGMPRLGHSGVLTEKQMQDVMALLLDPASPVNQ